MVIGFVFEGNQQFSFLAQSFLHGHLYFLHSIGGVGEDPVLYHGKIYWDEGPLPAVLLMPFVAFFHIFHVFFFEGYLKWLLVLGIFYFVFRLARLLSYSNEDSLILMFGFALGSVFIGVNTVSSAWLFSQVLTTFLLFWGLYEYFTHKRWWLMGVICALILTCRLTAVPIFIFFGLELWQTIHKNHERVRKFTQLTVPVIVAVILLGLYNFLRFHSPFNSGYEYQLVGQAQSESRSLGIFGLIHIPTNLYSAFLRGPVPVLRDSTSWTLKFPYIASNPYGMSMFITSPYLLNFFTAKWSTFDTRSRHLLIAIAVSALAVFSSYVVGLTQYGYRYSLDFLPELFLLFMIIYRVNHGRLSRGMKILLLGSGIFNFYMVWSFIIT